MTVVKRTNRCATVAFGCDRSTRARRTNERRECGCGCIWIGTDFQRAQNARDVGETRDDGDSLMRGVRVKKKQKTDDVCARCARAMTRVGRTRRFSRREPWLGRSI